MFCKIHKCTPSISSPQCVGWRKTITLYRKYWFKAIDSKPQGIKRLVTLRKVLKVTFGYFVIDKCKANKLLFKAAKHQTRSCYDENQFDTIRTHRKRTKLAFLATAVVVKYNCCILQRKQTNKQTVFCCSRQMRKERHRTKPSWPEILEGRIQVYNGPDK